jgi:phospholipid/cholesterol/gamma-HCH transport system substrate-binding protein
MTETLAAPRRFRGIRKQISMFLLTAVIGFAGVVLLVAYKQGMFVQHTGIYFHAPDATGINKGMSVRLYGVPVGAVKDIELAERGGVRVRLGINSDYMARLPRGSQARLVREGVVGAASIQIVTGTAGADRTPVAEGEEIKFIPHRSMTEMVDEVRQQMTPAFQELRKAAAEMGDPKGDFRKSLSAMRELIEQLPEANREMHQLLRTTDRTMLQLGRQAETVARQAEATLTVFNRLGTQAEQQLPMLAGKLATTLDSLNATATQVRETTRTNGEALRELLTQTPELVRGSGELVRDSQELAAAARRTWLLRDFIEPSQMRTLPVDSFESFGKR